MRGSSIVFINQVGAFRHIHPAFIHEDGPFIEVLGWRQVLAYRSDRSGD